MYHALHESGVTKDIDAEDMPYAVQIDDFEHQLDCLVDKKTGIFQRGDNPELVITFDDGHRSNLELAAPRLAERGLSAYFFITSGFIGKRHGFMNADEVNALSRHPGVVVGSHGVSHRFFADLSNCEAEHELTSSREALEAMTGVPCQSMSFPGGRYNHQVLKVMKTCGYRQWFGSAIDLVDVATSFSATEREESDNIPLQLQLLEQPLARVAIRRNTSITEFKRIIHAESSYFRKHKIRSHAKALLQRTLGNRLYHGLYKSISTR